MSLWRESFTDWQFKLSNFLKIINQKIILFEILITVFGYIVCLFCVASLMVYFPSDFPGSYFVFKIIGAAFIGGLFIPIDFMHYVRIFTFIFFTPEQVICYVQFFILQYFK